MPTTSKANQRAVAKYVKKTYDRIEIKIPKGRKAALQNAAEAVGESLNSYVSKAANERLEQTRASSIGNRIYTIIGGVNGTGKSSLTGVLKTQAHDLGMIVNVDELTVLNGVTAIEGGRIALRRIADCLESGASFTQEATLAGRRTAATAATARERGYYVRLFYVSLDTAEECLSRIANRVARGGHDISNKDVLRRFTERWNALERVLPYCNEARFFDNDNGFVEVAKWRDGALALCGDLRPAWLLEMCERLGQ